MAVRVDKVLAEREEATALAAQAMKDRDAAFADAEQWQAKAAEAHAAVKSLESHIAGLESEHMSQLVDFQNSRAEVYNKNTELEHALEVLRLEHQITVDRLVQQLIDLKVMLHHSNAELLPKPNSTPVSETAAMQKKRGPKPKTDLGSIGGTTSVAD